MKAENDSLFAQTELRVRLHVWLGSLRTTIRGRAQVSARVAVDVAPDWQLEPDVSISHVWVSRPSTHILGIKLSLGYRADRILRREILPRLEKRIHEEVRDALDLKPVMTELWEQLHEPVKLSESPSLWLVVEPIGLGLPSPTTANGQYQLTPWIESRLRVVPNPTSAASRRDLTLPALDKRAREGNSISISVPLEAPYMVLSEQVKTALSSENPIDFDIPGIGNADIEFDDVVIYPYPSSPKLKVGLRMRITSETPLLNGIEGWLWVSGTPQYRADQQLVVTDIEVDSDVEIDNRMWAVYNGFIRLWLRTHLSEMMAWDLAPYIAQLHELADHYLNSTLGDVLGDDGYHQFLDSRLVSNGALKDVRIGLIIPAADHLVIPVFLEAEFQLSLEPEA